MLNFHFLPHKDAQLLKLWLVISSVMIFLMVIIGGATRLTGSGLSMVEWQPLNFFPPVTENEWIKEFLKYQAFPEFKLINSWMELSDFKQIYWLEYFHRLWGRIIGIVFFLPFVYFYLSKKIQGPLLYSLVFLLFLGVLQGFLGWFMVSSGLINNPDVSQYRLAAHLSLAFLIYGLIIWIIPGIKSNKAIQKNRSFSDPSNLFVFSSACTILTLIVVIAGAFVAGLDAGLIFNTFPLMDNEIIPNGIYEMNPWYLNFFEDIMTVQFNHRLLALLLVISIVTLTIKIIYTKPTPQIKVLAIILAFVAIFQMCLGIGTLLLVVPIWLAIFHQSFALILFTISILLSRYIYNERFF